MKVFIYIVIMLFAKVSFGQSDYSDTTWHESRWKESSKIVAKYFRVYKKTEKGYLVYDKFLNNKTQMIAEASAINPELIQDGYSIYFDEDGNISSHGYCKNDKRIEDWIEYYNNGQDSALYAYKDGTIIATKGISKPTEKIYQLSEIMPEYPGGVRELMNFISKEIKYPKEARKKRWVGKSFIKFIVDKNGNVTEPIILKSSGYAVLDDEALRVIKLMPVWSPGSVDNKYVPVQFNIPINFTLKD